MIPYQFYHLLTTPLHAALPKLAAIAYQRDIRVCITADKDMLPDLDTALWTYDPGSFLPHGMNDEYAEHHPILLTDTPDTANNAQLLIITNGLTLQDEEAYTFTRIFDVFDGNHDEALQQARQRWKQYDTLKYPLTYVKQRDDGGWDTLKQVNQPDAETTP